ncbi:MAG: cas9 [Vampirovibrio sp.]|jgi:CRISPR-associated endonuclease Csn1|nr:cas9 [Vampirovibrio sp.]
MYLLGLDIGIASCGFGLIDTEAQKIVFTGVHLFDKAEVPKTGASLALPRRLARGQRRTIRRRAARRRHIKELLLNAGLPTDFIDVQVCGEKTPWELRKEGLIRILTPEGFARALYHLAKRRGFKSNRKDQKSGSEENKKMLGAAQTLKQQMDEAQCETIGAYLASQSGKKRNGNNEYSKTVLRDLVYEEVTILFEKQRSLGNTIATAVLEEGFKNIAFFQRPLHSVRDLVGPCSLEPDEPRAPKFSRSGELFVLWQKINHLRLLFDNGEERALAPEQRIQLFEKAHQIKTVNYSHIREICGSSDIPYIIKGLAYSWSGAKKSAKQKAAKAQEDNDAALNFEAVVKDAEKKVWFKMTGYHALKDILPAQIIDTVLWDTISEILSFEQDELAIEKALRGARLSLTEEQISVLKEIADFKGTVGHSCKAITNLLPFLESGETYDKAVVLAGYQKTERKRSNYLPAFEKTNNPVVDRALAQSRKVINAIYRRCQSLGITIDAIHIELGRELGKSWDDRQEIKKRQDANKALNDRLYQEMLDELKQNVGLTKYKLWKEQKGYCPYSFQYIKPEQLKDSLYTQIDHILPYRRTYDNSFFNLCLCLTTENQKKGDNTPWEYFGKDSERWDQFLAITSLAHRNKRRNFKNTNLTDSQEDAWKERHLNDTRYIARLLKTYLEEYLDFSGSPVEKKRRVMVVSGQITAHLRYQWGLNKDRAASANHHAQDALVIAATTQSMVTAITRYRKHEARHHELEVPKPWETFRDEVIEAVKNVFVSRMPRRKMSGQLHQGTIRSLRHDSEGKAYTVQRVVIESLNLDKLESLVDKERNQALYHTLKQRLEAFNNDGKKAFKDPVYMPTKDPNKQGPLIQHVRLKTNDQSGMEVRNGIASNGDVIRIDIFEKDNKYFMAILYAKEVYSKKLPNQVVKSGKAEADWPCIDASYTFKFSIYPKDLLKLISKDGVVTFGYYVTCDRSSGAIKIINHDETDLEKGKHKFGIQNLKSFEKCIVNYFGEVSLVKQEKRLELANPSRRKTRPTQPQAGPAGLPE